MSAPVAFPFSDHRPLSVALAEKHLAERQRLIWWTKPRRSVAGWPEDSRQARTVTVEHVEWWLEPTGGASQPRWIVLRNGREIARTRQLVIAQQTVARAVGAKIGG